MAKLESKDSSDELTLEINNLLTLESFLSERDNFQNVSYISPIPELCKEYPCILGIDEAGRGPVLGPMVYGTAFIPINEQTLLETLECADSKALNEEKRDTIFGRICEQSRKMGWAVEVIAPNSICNSMLSRSKYSLNQVSMDAAIGLIKAALANGVKVEYVYVDTVGKPEKYQDYLKTIFPDLNITVAKKADSTYPIVSAASICAKVTRDHALNVWKFLERVEIKEFGSGYPNDPVTKRFLVDHCDPVFGYPQLVRFSWSTAVNALEDTAYHVEWEEVTLYHWDLPQPIQDLGGWTNYLTADYFAEFARVAFAHFADRVKLWITINEPASICIDVYEHNNGAPDIKSSGIGSYICGKAILLAHAKAYRLYQAEFKNSQNGKVGITIDSIWAEPKSNNPSDLNASDREMQMSFGWFAHPIFSKAGGYPLVMVARIDSLSLKQNFTKSRLPSLSAEEEALLKGSADFLGLNHYHTWLVTGQQFASNDISFDADKGTKLEKDPNWADPEILPWGFTKLLAWVKEQYNNPLVYITENGIGDTTGTLNDTHRVQFMQEYVKAVYIAVNTYGCNVARYTAWSVMDNMEWTSGYTIKFGLYHVDFNNPARPRTGKQSAAFYKGLIMGKKFD